MNKTLTDWGATDWAGSGGFKIATWNVAGNLWSFYNWEEDLPLICFQGLRACAVNGGAEYLTHEAPDILCLQVLF